METVFAQNDDLLSALSIEKGITAIVGGGGKTSLMLRLSRLLTERGTVIVSTTTHIWPPEDMPIAGTAAAMKELLSHNRRICVGTPEEKSGKLIPCGVTIREMAQAADYVLLEADGAKNLPLKAPAAHEPVIPREARLVIAVAGLDGLGKPIQATCCRPELYAALCGKRPEDSVEPADVAKVLSSPEGQYKNVTSAMRFAVVLNKADNEALAAEATRIIDKLDASRVERVVITRLLLKEKE